jgi:hypothetical protein
MKGFAGPEQTWGGCQILMTSLNDSGTGVSA